MMKDNIVLIGMPGAGKSTVGVVLAKTLGYDFIDTDILMSRQTGMTLQAYIDAYGIEAFLKAEESVALSLSCCAAVIATGGSMVLSEAAMKHLKDGSVTVFIDVPLSELIRRLRNIKTRGIILKPGQTVGDVCRERLPLYRKYADFTVPEAPAEPPDIEAVVSELVLRLRGRHET
jgi:shikimate kinase